MTNVNQHHSIHGIIDGMYNMYSFIYLNLIDIFLC